MGIFYLSSEQEKTLILATGELKLNISKKDMVSARKNKEFITVSKSKINLISTKPDQMISVGTGLIPFLEHNDANRALMGSNMQRQAIAITEKENPYVQTGLEKRIAKDSESTLIAKNSGLIKYVSNKKIIVYEKIRYKNHIVINNKGEYLEKIKEKINFKKINEKIIKYKKRIYNLEKNKKSNQNTLIQQKTIVQKNQWVKKGEILADSNGTCLGKLSLGKNLLIGYTGWEGYNFEDAIVISEKLVSENIFTSTHVKKHKTFLINNENEGVRTNK